MARGPLPPDAQEVLIEHEGAACETYVFEPGAGEERLGWLFAALSTHDRDGIGSELLDTVATAIQREYYRDPKRSPGSSFELALHQANLILHDMAEQGMREWMVDFHASIVALAGSDLHISVAGSGQVLLGRKDILSDVSSGLSQSPITDPLQTFSQVASGTTSTRDIVYVNAVPITSLVSEPEIKRLSFESSANDIGQRLKQHVKDMTRGSTALSSVVVLVSPEKVMRQSMPVTRVESSEVSTSARDVNRQHLVPRQPLVIHHGTWQRFTSNLVKGSKTLFRFTRERIWPHVKKGSRYSGRVIADASRGAGKSIKQAASNKERIQFHIPSPKQAGVSTLRFTATGISRTQSWYNSLPKSSKIFGGIALILLLLLGGSLLLLQHKRASDASIQQASETLQDARTKSEAAKTALIYDNRDQAEGLLSEAQGLAEQLQQQNVYVAESQQLLTEIQEQRDRLQRISRANTENVKTIGDFSETISGDPKRIFAVADNLYAYDTKDNSIASMGLDGSTSIVHETSQGIGFLGDGIIHNADKTITFVTDPAGVALFDTKDNSLTSQDISFASTKPVVSGAAIFGNRLYLIDRSINNIFSYNKTLRGYATGTPWITDENFPVRSMTSIAVDGSVYTLHEDGTIHELFKGAGVEFNQEAVSPVIASDARIVTSDEFTNLYIIDPSNKRIVIYDKKGKLLKQHVVDVASGFADATIAPDESRAYILDGTRVLEISLVE